MENLNIENEKTSKQSPFIGHILKYEPQVCNTVSNEYTLTTCYALVYLGPEHMSKI